MYRIGLVGLVAVLVSWMPLDQPERGRDVAAQSEASAAVTPPKDKTWSWKGRVDRGDAIEIKGVNGDLHAERISGNDVEVEARLRGKKSKPETVKMEIVEHDGGVTICAVYPSDERDRPNECLPGTRGRMNVRNNDVEVEFTVRVPAGVDFVGRTVNGDVNALGIDGDVEVHTVNGDVDVSTTGLAEATTVNGSITVSMDRADWDGTLDFTTVNGNITLEMPSDLNSDVSVSTVNGQISSDFPLMVEGRFSPRHLKGTIGRGGRSLILKTVNGNVQLRRS